MMALYPNFLPIDFSQMNDVLNQINAEIGLSGLTLNMVDYDLFTLTWNIGDRNHRLTMNR